MAQPDDTAKIDLFRALTVLVKKLTELADELIAEAKRQSR